MWSAVAAEIGDDGISDALRERRGLLAPCAVLLPRREVERVEEAVRALSAVLAAPAPAAAILNLSGGSDLPDFGGEGWILGFDFHLTPQGPQLIEINTNPGGMPATAVQARALAALCPELGEAPEVEEAAAEAFLDEWRCRRGGRPLRTLAIIDDDPPGQYLYPEFLLYRKLLRERGIAAEILAPADFTPDRAEMVYNRLVDFALDSPDHAALARAWRSGGTLVTPDPRAHFLYSDKRALILLSQLLPQWVPLTTTVAADNAAELWAGRRDWFFKPAKGHAGKAVYRGDKLTRSVWPLVPVSSYVAQRCVPAPRLFLDHAGAALKMDLRANARRGRVVQMVARLYQGQTTNFRTAGGGFAPVFAV